MTLTIDITGPSQPVERAIRNLREVLEVLAETTQPDTNDTDLHKTIIVAAESDQRLNIKITETQNE